MLVLKENGEILIDENRFNSVTVYSDLDRLDSIYKVEKRITNSGSKIYRISDLNNGDICLLFLFSKNRLEWIEISLGSNYKLTEFIITEEEKAIIKEKLKDIGGEQNYLWPNVEYSESNKDGSVSILIKYHPSRFELQEAK